MTTDSIQASTRTTAVNVVLFLTQIASEIIKYNAWIVWTTFMVFFLGTLVNLNTVFYNIAYLITFFEKFGMDSLANYFFIGFEINFMISPGFILPEKGCSQDTDPSVLSSRGMYTVFLCVSCVLLVVPLWKRIREFIFLFVSFERAFTSSQHLQLINLPGNHVSFQLPPSRG